MVVDNDSWIRGLSMNQENFAYLKETLISLAKAENILNDFQSLTCSVCTRHFGYRSRTDADKIICSAPCMAVEEFQHKQNKGSTSKPVITSALNRTKNLMTGVPPGALEKLRTLGEINPACTTEREKKAPCIKTGASGRGAFVSVLNEQCSLNRYERFQGASCSSVHAPNTDYRQSVFTSGASRSDDSVSNGYYNDSVIYRSVSERGAAVATRPRFFEMESQKESIDETDKSPKSKEVETTTAKYSEDSTVGTKRLLTRKMSPGATPKSVIENEASSKIADKRSKNTLVETHGRTILDAIEPPDSNDRIQNPKDVQQEAEDQTQVEISKSFNEAASDGLEVAPKSLLAVPEIRAQAIKSGHSSDSSSSSELRGNAAAIEAARSKRKEPFVKQSIHTPSSAALINSRVSKVSVPKKMPNVTALSGQKVSPFFVKNVPRKVTWTIYEVTPSTSFSSKTPCYVQYVWNPTRFTLTAAADTSKLNELQTGIGVYCKLAPALTRRPSVGDILFSRYDGEFYRAEVKQVNSVKDELYVSFLDYGDARKVKISDCRESSDKLMKEHPIYGIIFECKYDGIIPKELPITLQMNKRLENVYIGGDVERKSGLEWVGSLSLGSINGQSWSEFLEAHLSALTKDSESASGTTDTMDDTSNVHDSRIYAFRRFLKDAIISSNLKHGGTVRVNHLWNYHKLTVAAVEDDKKLQQLNDIIAEHAKTAPAMSRKPQLQEILIAPYQGVYYRGVLESFESNNTAKIRFLDFGDEARIQVSDLREISKVIDAHPIYGIIFKLFGIPEDVPKLDIEGLEEALDSVCQMEVMQRDKDVWTGYLWLGKDQNWNDMVLDAMR